MSRKEWPNIYIEFDYTAVYNFYAATDVVYIALGTKTTKQGSIMKIEKLIKFVVITQTIILLRNEHEIT
jgi:hypothetical protein